MEKVIFESLACFPLRKNKIQFDHDKDEKKIGHERKLSEIFHFSIFKIKVNRNGKLNRELLQVSTL